MAVKPQSGNSESQKELDKVEKQLDQFNEQIKDLTQDRMNMAPKAEVEPQTKLSQSDLQKKKDIYLKPNKTVSAKDKFNEKFRSKYEYAKEYVNFIAENHEIIGENIDIWTRPFGGMPAEEWLVPVNTPVWGPRYLAEQIKSCSYHRLTMVEQAVTGSDGMGTYTGKMVVDTTVPRLDARPVNGGKSIFRTAGNF